MEYNLSRSYGYLLLYGESRKPHQVYRRIQKTVEEAMELLTKEDFERSRRAVYARSVQDWNSTTEIAENFMDFAFSGTDMLSYPEIISGTEFSDVQRRIRLSYNPSRLVLSVVKPAKEKK